jgi:hypothetical protein
MLVLLVKPPKLHPPPKTRVVPVRSTLSYVGIPDGDLGLGDWRNERLKRSHRSAVSAGRFLHVALFAREKWRKLHFGEEKSLYGRKRNIISRRVCHARSDRREAEAVMPPSDAAAPSLHHAGEVGAA